MKNERLVKVIPYLLILGGYFFLNRLPWMFALGCILVGIIMLIEQVWPEKWGDENN